MKGKYLTTVFALTSALLFNGIAYATKTTTLGAPTKVNNSATQTQVNPTEAVQTKEVAATAQVKVTPQGEIASLIQEAIQFVKDNGEEEAFKMFNNPKGPFSKGNTYVFAIDFKGNILAHGSDADMIGKNHYDFKDSKGRSVVRALIEKGRYGEGDWVNYFWKNPVTKTEECKSSFVTTFEKKFIIGAGYFHSLDAKGQCTNS